MGDEGSERGETAVPMVLSSWQVLPSAREREQVVEERQYHVHGILYVYQHTYTDVAWSCVVDAQSYRGRYDAAFCFLYSSALMVLGA